MKTIPLHALTEVAAPLVQDRLNKVFDEVQTRAHDLFVARGAVAGYDLDDWLKAEYEVCGWCPAELLETETKYTAHVPLAGFDASEIDVTLTPSLLVVEARHDDASHPAEGEPCVTELRHRHVMRHFHLAIPVRPESATATVSDGLLTVEVAKTSGEGRQMVAAAAG